MTILLRAGPLSYGVHPQLLRAAARNLLAIHSAEVYDLCVVLGVSWEVGEPIWRAMEADGFMEMDSTARWRPSERMRLLATARIGHPLTRTTAERLLHQTIENARAINALPPEAPYFYVASLAVFGAFLDLGNNELENLDLAWTMRGRPGVDFLLQERVSPVRDPAKSTRGRLRPRSAFVRLTSMNNLVAQDITFRLVYQLDVPVGQPSLMEKDEQSLLDANQPQQARQLSSDAAQRTGVDRARTEPVQTVPPDWRQLRARKKGGSRESS